MLLEKKINIKISVLNYIRYKRLNWYGHMQIMDEERLPREILELCPPRRRKRKPRNSCMQEVTTGLREKGINNMAWVD
jgi:hypothetical protein